MAEKRKDNKGRVLRNGESQRSDGRYEYKYTDAKGDRRSVYSWKLVDTDKVPTGKRVKESLREMEKRIQKDIDDGIALSKDMTTVEDFYKILYKSKSGLKQHTKIICDSNYRNHIKNELGQKKVSKIKHRDIVNHYVYLANEKNLSLETIKLIHSLVSQIFNLAVKENCIRTNPTLDAIKDLKSEVNLETKKRQALTEEEQARFVEVISKPKNKHWKPLLTFLLGTGCRIGEALGMRWCDCNLEEGTGVVSVNHTLIYCKQDNGKMGHMITSPKTKSGTREFYMLPGTKEVLLEEYERQKKVGFSDEELNGYKGFIFTTKRKKLIAPQDVCTAINIIVKNANKEETQKANLESRKPVLLPHISPHILRHTYCTRLFEQGVNIKVIQEVMGHSNLSTTMDTYTTVTKKKKKQSFEALEGKIKVC